MKRLNYAELKGEGNKISEFTRAFVNGMASTNVKIRELPCNSDEIKLKMTTNHFTKGIFHAINDKGDLYYRAYIKDDNAKYWGIMGILVLIGGGIFLLSSLLFGGFNFILGIICIAPVVVWMAVGQLASMGKEPEKVELPIALSSAEAEIRIL